MPIEKMENSIRAEFKELARKIIANDRAAQKDGLSQNTIGEIERAQVAAYRRGRSANAEKEPTSVPQLKKVFVDWIVLPPRCRDTLWSISCTLDQAHSPYSDEPIVLEQILVAGRVRWRRSGESSGNGIHTFSEGGVGPLVKLGLLNKIGEQEAKLILSPMGIATCKEYWRRWHERDPTLPKISLRA
jgi:hypothetical protein